MDQQVSTEVADRMRAMAWRVRPMLGPDRADDAERNEGRGLNDTLAMIIAAGCRKMLSKGSDVPLKSFMNMASREGLERVAACLRDGTCTGPADEEGSFPMVAPHVHVWIARDGTIVAGQMKDGCFNDQAVEIAEVGGDWTITMRQPVPQHMRNDVMRRLANSLSDVLTHTGMEMGSSCHPGGVNLLLSRRIDRREGDGDRINELVIRHDEALLDRTIARIAGEIRGAAVRHDERMGRIRETMDRLEAACLGHGYHVRLELSEKTDAWQLAATHLGAAVPGILESAEQVPTIARVEDVLERSLRKVTSCVPSCMRHFDPAGVCTEKRRIDACILMMARDMTPNAAAADLAIRRILAHGDRSWSCEHLSDLFGRPVETDMVIHGGRNRDVRATMQLTPDISLKRGVLVMRRSKLPETIMASLEGRRVHDLVSHPWLPDAVVERVTSGRGNKGETYSLVLKEVMKPWPGRRAA